MDFIGIVMECDKPCNPDRLLHNLNPLWNFLLGELGSCRHKRQFQYH